MCDNSQLQSDRDKLDKIPELSGARVGKWLNYMGESTCVCVWLVRCMYIIGGSKGGVPSARPPKGPDSFILTYSRARLIRMANAQKNRANYPSMRIIQTYFTLRFNNVKELCPGQPCELSGRCELATVKLPGLHCTKFSKHNRLGSPCSLLRGPHKCVFTFSFSWRSVSVNQHQ